MAPSSKTMAPDFEPRLARVAAAIADPSRARTLARLLDGRLHSAGELARHAGVTPATMSAHLKLLVDEGLACVREQARHRYFGLADGNVGHALEALMRVAKSPAQDELRWQRPAMKGLRYARTCYGHLAGELGVLLHDRLLQKGWACTDAQGSYHLTASGIAALCAAGLHGFEPAHIPTQAPTKSQTKKLFGDPIATPSCANVNIGSGRTKTNHNKAGRQLYDCVDWSERRDHFAGPTAAAILDAFIDKGWLTQHPGSRALIATHEGKVALIDGLLAN